MLKFIKKRDVTIQNLDLIFKIAFSIFSQSILGSIAVLTSIILPSTMGPEQYGYYQLFMFYVVYLNLLGFGINDGLSLNYAGEKQAMLPILRIRRAIHIQIIYTCILTFFVMGSSLCWFSYPRNYIMVMVGINLIPTILFCTSSGLFLMENKSYLYNVSNMLQRLLFCIFIIALLFMGINSAKYIIVMYTMSAFIMLPIVVYPCRFYIIGCSEGWACGWAEYKKLSMSGMKVAFSTFAVGVIPLFGRVVIEIFESPQTYGIFSFYTGLLSVILAFTNAIGIIAFPIMRNSDMDKLTENYLKIERLYVLLGMSIFIVYPITVSFIERYMVEYISGVCYFPFLFATCYPLGKIQMLLFPYYKTQRKENILFYVNLISFIIAIAITFMSYKIYSSPKAVAIGTTISCMVYFGMMISFSSTVTTALYENIWIVIFDWCTPLIFLLGIQCFSDSKRMIFYATYIFTVMIYLIRRYQRKIKK